MLSTPFAHTRRKHEPFKHALPDTYPSVLILPIAASLIARSRTHSSSLDGLSTLAFITIVASFPLRTCRALFPVQRPSLPSCMVLNYHPLTYILILILFYFISFQSQDLWLHSCHFYFCNVTERCRAHVIYSLYINVRSPSITANINNSHIFTHAIP